MALFVFWRLFFFFFFLLIRPNECIGRRGKAKQSRAIILPEGINSDLYRMCFDWIIFQKSVNHKQSSVFACDNKCRAFLAIRMDEVLMN